LIRMVELERSRKSTKMGRFGFSDVEEDAVA